MLLLPPYFAIASSSMASPSFSIFCLFPFLFLFLVSASQYVLPQQFFINCGSAHTINDINGRNFYGDVNPVDMVSFPSSRRTTVAEDRDLPDGLYRTARVFTEPSSYEFGIEKVGSIHVVRFHFLQFSSTTNPSPVRFHVSASGTLLLSNFTVGFRNFTHFPPVEEFLLRIPFNKLRIEFTPSAKDFIAFVNAIEVFPAPSELLSDYDSSIPYVTPAGWAGYYNDHPNDAVHVIHRINVGGPNIMPKNDTLFRYWIPDDNLGFMINRNATTLSGVFQGELLGYNDPGRATKYNAPEDVYRTAREMKVVNEDETSNITVKWRFIVRRRTLHLLRLHFCNIMTISSNAVVKFNVYIFNNVSGYEISVSPWDLDFLKAPFFQDFVVMSDSSGFMNIGIGPSENSSVPTTAFLNGIEIMERIGNLSSNSTRRPTVLIIAVSTSGGGIFLLSLVIVTFFLVSRNKRKKSKEASDRPLILLPGDSWYTRHSVRTTSNSALADLSVALRIPLSEIHIATNQFDDKCMIGKGGFGKVYKGMLNDGRKVAVKRSEPGHGQGISEFHTEIVILSKLSHRHLVSLIGYCDESQEMILVYEFMENGTLRDHLYTSSNESNEMGRQRKLSWEERLKICIGAAEGLHYLHTGPARAFIHRDIKSTNILLNEHYVAKVADFGLSCSRPDNESHVTTQVKGSFGYFDPEYFKLLRLTQKSDVYAFGVVLLEVVCARAAVNVSLPEEQMSLASWGLSWIKKDELERIIDPFLVGNVEPNCLRRFGKIVDKCLQEYGADRPEMKDVLWDLEYCLKRHAFGQAYEDSCPTDIVLGLPIPPLFSEVDP